MFGAGPLGLEAHFSYALFGSPSEGEECEVVDDAG